MPLDPRYLNSVVRITSAGDLLGSGSIIGVPSESNPRRLWPYLVTAFHVVRTQVLVEVEVADPAARGVLLPPVSVESDQWYAPLSDVDLAIAPFPLREVPRYQITPLDRFVPDGAVVPLGGPVHYLGVFAPANAPVCRTGAMAAYEVEIEKEEFNVVYKYRADLLDCRSYRGFSGSACFSSINHAILDDVFEPEVPEGELRRVDGSVPRLGRIASATRFCGVFTAHYSDDLAAPEVTSRYGVGVMIPSDTVRAALLSDRARAERAEMDRRHDAAAAAEMPPLENVGAEQGGNDSSSEFERFEDLTRRLVQVPKKDLGD